MFKEIRLRTWLTAGGVVAIFALVSVGIVWAQGMGQGQMGRRMGPRGMGPFGFGPMLNGRLAQQLNLTDAQKQDIRAILQSHQQDFQALRQEGADLHTQMQTAIDNNDTAALDNLAGPLGQFQVKMARLRAQVRSEVFAKLMPEQQAKARDLQDRMATRMQNMRQRWQQRQQRQTGGQF